MKQWAVIVLCLALTSGIRANDPDKVRSTFMLATQDLDLRAGLVEGLRVNKGGDPSFRSAYLGASLTLLAECSLAPWTKYKQFVQGTELLEEAIAAEPNETEFRYLRFIIQINAPSFLNYDENLKEDYLAIKNTFSDSTEEALWMKHYRSFEKQHGKIIREQVDIAQ
ncbi:MAG: hypothetical protein HQ500_01430 [Flavobacteriales bacterium]|nr:hypothetical protein [Flavobacteriales bacterium]